jgi:hypothetical protein
MLCILMSVIFCVSNLSETAASHPSDPRLLIAHCFWLCFQPSLWLQRAHRPYLDSGRPCQIHTVDLHIMSQLFFSAFSLSDWTHLLHQVGSDHSSVEVSRQRRICSPFLCLPLPVRLTAQSLSISENRIRLPPRQRENCRMT